MYVYVVRRIGKYVCTYIDVLLNGNLARGSQKSGKGSEIIKMGKTKRYIIVLINKSFHDWTSIKLVSPGQPIQKSPQQGR